VPSASADDVEMIDARGLEVTCSSLGEVAAIDDFGARMVGLARGAAAVLGEADRYRETPLLQLYGAAAWLFAQTAEGDRNAAGLLARAAELAPAANPREERWRTALEAWQRHAFLAAADTLESLTDDWPGDLPAAKACEFLYYVLGQQHEGARFRRHMERLAPRHGDDPDFLAMLAFALELTDDFRAARATAEHALELRRENPWADHALSHVWIRTGEIEAAIAHLEAALPIWRSRNPIILAHDGWHLAIHHLERLDFDAALARLDACILPDVEGEIGPLADTIALLWRLEMAGHPCDQRWHAIAERIETHLAPTFMPFLSAHVAYALARADRTAALERLLGAVDEQSRRGDPDSRRSWSRAGRALVEAAAAFGAGDASRAVWLLAPVVAEVTVGGGSDAQCDLFRLTWVRALAASGRRVEAVSALEGILGAKAETPLDRHWRALLRR
jgi:tetratricopeptide (TPR) repeat protein